MGISEQDREWIKAMISQAATEVLSLTKDYVTERFSSHEKSCPFSARLRFLITGISIGTGIAGGGLGYTLAKFLS